ncbi:MAG: hypothetical protein GY771_10630 [bacterium]|nr:hypothetical protein [bacterium]
MKFSKSTLTVILFAIFTQSAFGFISLKTGYTTTTGEISNYYDGGFYLNLGVKIPIFGPVKIVPNGMYASLGENALFSKMFSSYIEGELGGLIPPEIGDLGEINSSLYTAGVGVNVALLDHYFVGISVEPGAMYVRREMNSMGIPLSILEQYIPGFDLPIEPNDGYGFYAGGEVKLLNKFPVISFTMGGRFIMAPNMGRSSVEEYLENYMEGYTAPDAKHITMFAFYGGLGFF